MDQLGIGCRICLGDIVGYGGNPNECVEETRLSVDRCVAGNHDRAAVGGTSAGHFNPQAQAAVLWTGEVLTEPNRRFLSGAPLVAQEESIFFVHASPMEPSQWHYVVTTESAERAFERFQERLCLIGHSHRPLVAAKESDRRCKLSVEAEICLREKLRYVINVGSVGQPRDGDPRASFLVLDTGEGRASIERVPYDTAAAGRAILDAGLPASLAERLQHGK